MASPRPPSQPFTCSAKQASALFQGTQLLPYTPTMQGASEDSAEALQLPRPPSPPALPAGSVTR